MGSAHHDSLLEERFEKNRPRLRLLALRLLGTLAEADDALQETWLRVSRSDVRTVENFDAWVTTLTSRVCIDMLRARAARRETLVGLHIDGIARSPRIVDPEREALLAEAIGSALLTVLENLSPAERVSLVLHDMFDVPFDEVAAILGRSETAVRQLESRARRRVRGAPSSADVDAAREREVVRTFLAAAREGNFEALLELLSPDAVSRADKVAATLGAETSVLGNAAIAERVARGGLNPRYALVNGKPGLFAIVNGNLRVVLTYTIENGKIVEIQVTADPDVVDRLDLVVFEG
ncbi:MAG TPA: sigma-70 family RNA polymerase sigma factor [Spirochaetia bacterium]|nr:sigma-70 family RNA polymerase sigma factor [Spirochaetia bacterium]